MKVISMEQQNFMRDYTLEEARRWVNWIATVPEGQLFVMGGNRQVSVGNIEEVGYVDVRNRVMGKAFLRLYPSMSGGLC